MMQKPPSWENWEGRRGERKTNLLGSFLFLRYFITIMIWSSLNQSPKLWKTKIRKIRKGKLSLNKLDVCPKIYVWSLVPNIDNILKMWDTPNMEENIILGLKCLNVLAEAAAPNKRPVMPEFLDKYRVRNATSNHKLSNAVVLGSRWNGATPSRQFSEMRSVKMQIGISVALEKKQRHFHDWIRNIFTVAFEIRAKKSRIGFQMKLTSFYFDINNFESFKLNMSESEI